jgi:hypothetical protein
LEESIQRNELKQHLVALLTINSLVLLFRCWCLNLFWLPLNQDGNPSMSGDLALIPLVLLPIPIYSIIQAKADCLI